MTSCCDAFAEASLPWSDKELAGPLMAPDGDRWHAGSHELPFIIFCPWCGANIVKPSPLLLAAKEVVRARYQEKEWEPLKDAIAELAEFIEMEERTKK